MLLFLFVLSVEALDSFVCVMVSTVTYHDYMISVAALFTLRSLSKLPQEETVSEPQNVLA